MTANMFDDLILKARDICDTASKKTSELCEISRYKYECIRINGEIKKLYEQLGSSVYSMVKKKYENAELIASLTEEIDGQLARLREINQILTGLQRVAVCPVCGVKNDEANCFCAKCGARMKPEPAPEGSDIHYSEDIEG